MDSVPDTDKRTKAGAMVSLAQLLTRARQGGYAVCYCESWNLESLQAVIEAAEAMRSPVVAGFNGGFLMHPSRAKPENLAHYAGLAGVIREASVPVAFLLNETESLPQIERGIELGFNSVMVENEHLSLGDYRRLIKQVVALAHPLKVSVEAQIGRLPTGSSREQPKGEITNPAEARALVEETGIDALAVSIGNVHILTQGKAPVDLEVLERIQSAVKIPLVLHGGTSFPSACAREVISRGIVKFNFGTCLKQAYLTAVKKALARYQEPMNPHVYLGMGGPEDILQAGREAVKQKAMELIHDYGFGGEPRKVL
ncbi:MAG: class II fructose-bisphosphate aldolase [Candidatus Omnitrophica bacterium]|nr:class II fructose-bisphosphate aldolase [Candidatus Omnitrophota bacterium]